MKSSVFALALVAAISAFVTSPAAAADVCDTMVRGQQCTNLTGQKSRCSRFDKCISYTACDSNLKLLQTCHSFKTVYCYPLFDGEPLQCLDALEIETVVQANACIDKADGTPCKSAYTELNGRAGLTATVYEQDGVCESFYCLNLLHMSCTDKPLLAACTYEGVENGNIVRFDGTCRSNFPYRNKCEKSRPGTILRAAKLLVANAPIATTSAPSTSSPSKTPSPSSKTPSPSKTPSASRSSSNSTKSPTDQFYDDLMAPFTPKPTPSSTPTPTPTPTSSASSNVVASAAAAVSVVAAFLCA